MVIEFGYFCLIFTFILIGFILFSSIDMLNINFVITKFIFFFFTLSLISLIYSYITSDFSVITILENSHITLPLLYKFCGLWSNHEGSILLWSWVLILYLFIGILFINIKDKTFYYYFLKIQNFIIFFFFFLIIISSNPFLRLNFYSFNGTELNPLLQDPGLAIHPPFLYLGSLGFSIPFTLMLVYLLLYKTTPLSILIYIKIFTSISWILLTIGITLGSWWAYYELGWGGWWFWDPVENISLIPWLLGTALLHSIIISIKYKRVFFLTIFLSIFSFLCSLVGTFLVRSGLLVSVHSFAKDLYYGLLIFSFLLILFSYCCFLYYKYAPKVIFNKFFFYVSKEGFLFLNNYYLLFITFLIALGTFSPILFSSLFQRQVSIGFEFFNNILIPLMFSFVIFMFVSPFINWRNDNFFKSFIFFEFLLGSVIYFCIYFIFAGFLLPTLILIISGWCIISLFYYLFKIKQLTPLFLSHFGFCLFLIANCLSTIFQSTSSLILLPGEAFNFNNFTFILREIKTTKGSNYLSFYGNFLITNKENQPVATLFPEKRLYYISNIFLAKPAISSNFLSDLYIMIGDGNIYNGWYTKVFYNPLMSILWLSSILIIFSGILSVVSFKRKNTTGIY